MLLDYFNDSHITNIDPCIPELNQLYIQLEFGIWNVNKIGKVREYFPYPARRNIARQICAVGST
jgi:hypothetical protein